MADMILDTTRNVKLSASDAKRLANELNALGVLYHGLVGLFTFVEKIEKDLVGQNPNLLTSGGFGALPGLKGIDQSWLANLFYWYSVSLCNYLGLIGWIGRGQGQLKENPEAYTRTVAPEVYAFRNKVGAHLARWKLHSSDNEATRLISAMWQLGWMKGRFIVPAMQLHISGPKKSQTSQMKSWSMTETHVALHPRLWGTFKS